MQLRCYTILKSGLLIIDRFHFSSLELAVHFLFHQHVALLWFLEVKDFGRYLPFFYNISRHQCYIRLTHNFMLEFLFITTTHSYMYIDLHQHFLSRIINSLVALSPPSFPWMISSLFTQESLCHIVDQFSQCFHPRLPRLLFCSSTIHSSMLDSFFPTISLWIPLCKWIYYWMSHFSTNCSLVYIQCIASSSSEPGTTWVLFNRE